MKSDNFEWQTEEEEVWEALENVSEEAESPAPPRRLWPTLTIVAILLALVGGVVYWQVQQRIEAATTAVTADILSTHNLIAQAAADKDTDLLTPLLSGREVAWTEAQERLLLAGALYDRALISLPLAETETAVLTPDDEKIVDIILSPDLNEAELQYAMVHESFAGEPVSLVHTAVYRRGRERWLFSPPTSEFWGDWQTDAVAGIEYAYPARDADIANQIAAELGPFLTEMCTGLPELACPEPDELSIRFDTNPDSLTDLLDSRNLFGSPRRLNLPTPTLVGLPLDEDGTEALVTGYKVLLGTAVIADSIDYTCCEGLPFVQALIDLQLSELQLKPWPVTLETYMDVVEKHYRVEDLLGYWTQRSFNPIDFEAHQNLYAFIDFLHAQQDASSVTLLQSIAAPRSYFTWLSALFNDFPVDGTRGLPLDGLAEDWWFYAFAQAESSQQARPIAYPDQDLMLICSPAVFDSVPRHTLFQYAPSSEAWQEQYTFDNGIMFMNPLPTDDVLVLQSFDLNFNQWHAYLWRPSDAMLELPADVNEFIIYLGQSDPDGRYLLSYAAANDETEAGISPSLTNLETCDDSSCGNNSLELVPVWSPGGEQALLSPASSFDYTLIPYGERVLLLNNNELPGDVPLYRTTADSLLTEDEEPQAVPLGSGGAPFWLTERLYGYIRSRTDALDQAWQQELVVASITDDVPESLVSSEDLMAAIPEEERPPRLSIRYAIANPTNSDQVALMASVRSNGYLFLIDQVSGRVELRLQFAYQEGHAFSFSPNGRFFVVSGVVDSDLYLHDIEQNETKTYHVGPLPNAMPSFTFDWSADSNWLAFILNTNVMALVAPAEGYQQFILHDQGDCNSLAWMNAAR